MTRTRISNCLGLGLLVPVGLLASRESLFRLLQGEGCNAAVYKALSQIFQDINHSMTMIFNKMAAEEWWHVRVLSWFYQKRFGSVPQVVQPEKFDSKTLKRALDAGLCRLLREKLAEKRCANRPAPRWATGVASGLARWARGSLRWRSRPVDSVG